MWSWLVGLFTGGFGKATLDTLLSLIDKYITDDTQRDAIAAEVTEKWLDTQVQMALIRKDAFGGWAWIMAALFLPMPALWWNAVFLASVFPQLHLTVLALPSDFYPWLTTIIGALFFAPTINTTATKLLGK